MKTMLLATVSPFALAVSAIAADLPARPITKAPIALPVQVSTGTGRAIGAFVIGRAGKSAAIAETASANGETVASNIVFMRSEERRVGKECRSRGAPCH